MKNEKEIPETPEQPIGALPRGWEDGSRRIYEEGITMTDKETKLTEKQRCAMEAMDWAQRNFGGGLITNSYVSKRTVQQLVNKGLSKSNGFCPVCDDDGFELDNRQPRESFVLTPDGRIVAEEEGII